MGHREIGRYEPTEHLAFSSLHNHTEPDLPIYPSVAVLFCELLKHRRPPGDSAGELGVSDMFVFGADQQHTVHENRG